MRAERRSRATKKQAQRHVLEANINSLTRKTGQFEIGDIEACPRVVIVSDCWGVLVLTVRADVQISLKRAA